MRGAGGYRHTQRLVDGAELDAALARVSVLEAALREARQEAEGSYDFAAVRVIDAVLARSALAAAGTPEEPRTKQDFCGRRVPAGGPFCTNPPTHDVETNYGFMGSLCDEHWDALVFPAGSPSEPETAEEPSV